MISRSLLCFNGALPTQIHGTVAIYEGIYSYDPGPLAVSSESIKGIGNFANSIVRPQWQFLWNKLRYTESLAK